MSLAGPPVYYFLSLSSVAVLNMEGGAGARLKGKGGEWCWAILRSWFVILRPRAVAESHSRGFGAKPGGCMCVIGPTPACMWCIQLNYGIFLLYVFGYMGIYCIHACLNVVDKPLGFICATHE